MSCQLAFFAAAGGQVVLEPPRSPVEPYFATAEVMSVSQLIGAAAPCASEETMSSLAYDSIAVCW